MSKKAVTSYFISIVVIIPIIYILACWYVLANKDSYFLINEYVENGSGTEVPIFRPLFDLYWKNKKQELIYDSEKDISYESYLAGLIISSRNGEISINEKVANELLLDIVCNKRSNKSMIKLLESHSMKVAKIFRQTSPIDVAMRRCGLEASLP